MEIQKEPFIQIHNVAKKYGNAQSLTFALHDLNLNVEAGEICVILGSSGSGKSTLLHCLGGLERIDGGSIRVSGEEISSYSSKQAELYRRNRLGFVFQQYQLIPNLTVAENVEVCAHLTAKPIPADELFGILGLTEHKDKYPYMLSGGQQQRCAIARAVVKNPPLLLCDEPTGALDSRKAKEILILLDRINRQYGTTILLVTHNQAIKAMANRVVILQDGAVKETYLNETRLGADELEGL